MSGIRIAYDLNSAISPLPAKAMLSTASSATSISKVRPDLCGNLTHWCVIHLKYHGGVPGLKSF